MVGVWFWETGTPPAYAEPAYSLVDEVWTCSDFVANVFAKGGRIPVRTFSHPFDVDRLLRAVVPDRFQWDGRHVFLFAFDFNSSMGRKNPLALCESYLRAFPHENEVIPETGKRPLLVVKSINGHRCPVEWNALRAAGRGRRDIVFIDEFLSDTEKDGLMSRADSYVSLHRSEGLGLTLLEAMAMGKPCIATGFSGNLAFMTEENSFLAQYRLVPVGPGDVHYPASDLWAEVDTGHAAELMRRVATDPEEAAAKGALAAREILGRNSLAAAGAELASMLADLIAKPPIKKDFSQVLPAHTSAMSRLRDVRSTLKAGKNLARGTRRVRPADLASLHRATAELADVASLTLKALKQKEGQLKQRVSYLERLLSGHGQARLAADNPVSIALAQALSPIAAEPSQAYVTPGGAGTLSSFWEGNGLEFCRKVAAAPPDALSADERLAFCSVVVTLAPAERLPFRSVTAAWLDRFLLDPGTFEVVRKFAADAVRLTRPSHPVRYRQRLVPSQHWLEGERWVPTNPSLVRTRDGYLANLRLVNYRNRRATNPWFADGDGVVRSRNLLQRLDASGQRLSEHLLELPPGMARDFGPWQGLEDLRLFLVGDRIGFSASYAQLRDLAVPRLVFGLTDLDPAAPPADGAPVAVASLTELMASAIDVPEKNWMPLALPGQPIEWIARLQPFKRVRLDPETGALSIEADEPSRTAAGLYLRNLRGGCGPVLTPAGRWWSLGHFHGLHDGRFYHHRWIEHDPASLRPVAVTEPFCWDEDAESCEVEFACGLCVGHDGLLWVTYGKDDREGVLARVAEEDVAALPWTRAGGGG